MVNTKFFKPIKEQDVERANKAVSEVFETEKAPRTRRSGTEFFDLLTCMPADFMADGRDDALPQDRENP